MNVSIVITCWNGKQLLEKNLPQVISAWENPKNQIDEVLVVDDASTDDSVSYLEKNFPQVRIVKQERNLGYAATCNRGVQESKSDLVAILNLDVVPEKDFLELALSHFRKEKVFAVSFGEGCFGPGKLAWENGFLEIEKTNVHPKVISTAWPNGGSSVFRKKIWKELGGMDELFLPFYFEDIDLGIRAAKAGYQSLLEPKAKVKHEHEATINERSFKRNYIDFIKKRNHLLLTWKNLDSAKLKLFHLTNLGKRCLFHPKYIIVVLGALMRLIKVKIFNGT